MIAATVNFWLVWPAPNVAMVEPSHTTASADDASRFSKLTLAVTFV
jgi:hypothetical protein